MLRASCSYCQRLRWVDAILLRGWKVHGDTVLCVHCRRRRYRRRSLTTKVLEPVGAAWPELRGALEESATRCIDAWEARVADGGPVVRVLLESHWCELRLKHASWRTEQRRIHEKIASGEVTAELETSNIQHIPQATSARKASFRQGVQAGYSGFKLPAPWC